MDEQLDFIQDTKTEKLLKLKRSFSEIKILITGSFTEFKVLQ